jgi:hypothetical protein
VYACEICQPLREVEDNGVDKTVGEDASGGQIKASKRPGRVVKAQKDEEEPVVEKKAKTSVKKSKESTKTTTKIRFGLAIL